MVPTPIGNMKDITLRAIEVLMNCDMVLAEDTRTTGILLKHHQITKPLSSFHLHNEHVRLPGYINLLKEGKKIALCSDAGTPCISDPGFLLARECNREGIKIEALPGATAFVPALVKSGLPSERFVFEGFLPVKKGRQTRFKQLADEYRTMIFYESPHKLIRTLEDCIAAFGGNRLCSVSRELTKIYEETINATLTDCLSHFQKNTPKGEFVIVIAGKNE